MDKRQRSTLRKCRVQVVKDLIIDDVFDSIEGQEIFTSIMLETIKGETSRPEKVRKLLDHLPRRGPMAFDKFIYCLQQSEHGSLANALLQEYSEQCGISQPMESAGEVMPSNREGLINEVAGPRRQTTNQAAVINEMAGPRRQTYDHEEGDTEMNEVYRQAQSSGMEAASGESIYHTAVQESATPPSGHHAVDSASLTVTTAFRHGYTGNTSEEYKMDSDPRGFLLIINNRRFAAPMSDRDGTDVDAANLHKLFMSFGFGVDLRHDLTAQEMQNNLGALAKLPDLNTVDCLAVAVLSHGSDEVIFGVDCQQVIVHKILQLFNAENCPAMQHKPKFFIINACRGENEDLGSLPNNINSGSANVAADAKGMKSNIQCSSDRMPNLQDFLIAYSTIPRHVNYRHLEKGTWFIQGLVKVFSELADQKHVVDMLVKVNQEVSKNVCKAGVQIPAPQVMLTRNWYLNPKPQATS